MARSAARSLRVAGALVYLAVTLALPGEARADQASNAQASPVPRTEERDDYLLGPDDVVNIVVWNQKDLSGEYVIEGDGMLTFPLIGAIKAEGFTPRAVEAEMTRRLSDGFLREPQVSVSILQYRSQRVYVVGEVKQPGAYPLTRNTTLIEVLTRAGATLNAMTGEVTVVRPRPDGKIAGPVLPDHGNAADVIRIDLRDLETGIVARDLALRDGDTIVVPEQEKVYVMGEVRNPGAYAVSPGTTLLQLISIAGGLTDRGAVGRTRAYREVKGEKKEVKLKGDDVVQPGDTITVPQRLF
jgi:polysaccharide export outer membrane protein